MKEADADSRFYTLRDTEIARDHWFPPNPQAHLKEEKSKVFMPLPVGTMHAPGCHRSEDRTEARQQHLPDSKYLRLSRQNQKLFTTFLPSACGNRGYFKTTLMPWVYNRTLFPDVHDQSAEKDTHHHTKYLFHSVTKP